MNIETSKTMRLGLVVLTSALLAVTSLVGSAVVRSRDAGGPSSKAFVVKKEDPEPRFKLLVASGFQANSSAPLVLEGEMLGDSAVWKRLTDPIFSNTFAMIPPAAGGSTPFDGAGCVTEYFQAEIVTPDGSTLTGSVYGVRCEPHGSSGTPTGAHNTNGIYAITGGTGKFEDVTRGVGTISIDARADGSTILFLEGPNCQTCLPLARR
jgi:hypothetical protein